jgi:hypothetical protein
LTIAPLFTVSEEGSNAKFLMIMVFSPAMEVVGAAVTGGALEEEHPAAIQETIKRTTQANRKSIGSLCA